MNNIRFQDRCTAEERIKSVRGIISASEKACHHMLTQNDIVYVDNDKKILRYTARFNTKVPEDLDRRFIISFYLADDTISIFEPAQKNSGIIEGPFLERRKYKNIDKGDECITPSDLPVGGDIKINGYNFHILGCDDYTTKYLSSHTYE